MCRQGLNSSRRTVIKNHTRWYKGKEMKSIFRRWSGPRSDMNGQLFQTRSINRFDSTRGPDATNNSISPVWPVTEEKKQPTDGWSVSPLNNFGRKYVSAVTGRPAALIINKVRVCVWRPQMTNMYDDEQQGHSLTHTHAARQRRQGKKMHYTQKRGIAAMNQIELGHVSGWRKKQKKKRTNMAVYNSLPFSWILFCFFFFHRLFYFIISFIWRWRPSKNRLPHFRLRFKLRKWSQIQMVSKELW